MVSIHAPARGATLRDQAVEALTETVSIHAPARGATPSRLSLYQNGQNWSVGANPTHEGRAFR